MYRALVPLVLAAALAPALLLRAQGPAGDRDYMNVGPLALGIRTVLPKKDARTGFVVAGQNDTELIRKLTEINGRPVADLEVEMRPKKLSKSGFLGGDEKLLDVLAADNEYVRGELGRTHQDVALPLLVAGTIGVKSEKQNEWAPFRYHGRRYRVKVNCFRGFQESPFRDGTKANCDAQVEILDSGKKITTACWCR